MELCTTYQNTHHQSTVVIGSQRGKTCWPFMFKLMSNIKYSSTQVTRYGDMSFLHSYYIPSIVGVQLDAFKATI